MTWELYTFQVLFPKDCIITFSGFNINPIVTEAFATNVELKTESVGC